MKSVILIACLVGSLTALSQEDSAPVRNSGIYSRASAGILTGQQSNASFQVSNGYRFRFGLEAGLGLGFETYYYSRYAPLFVETRYHFFKGNTSPFIGLMGGYLAGLGQNYYYSDSPKGMTAGACVGLTHYFTRHIGISTTIGYRFSQTNQHQHYYWLMEGDQTTLIQEMQRVEMRIGIVFR